MPLHVRIILWTAFGFAILVASVMAVMTLAGNTSPDRQRWTLFVGAFIGLLVLQGGYLLAPFTVGRNGWLFWVTLVLMVPAVIAVIGSISTPVYLAITATRPDGASGWRTIAGIGPFAVLALIIYVLPAVFMVLYRPRGA